DRHQPRGRTPVGEPDRGRSPPPGAGLQPVPAHVERRRSPHDPGPLAPRHRPERHEPRPRAARRRPDQRPVRGVGLLGSHPAPVDRADRGRPRRVVERVGQRGNGTPLQFNRTGSGAFATGGRLRAGEFGELATAVYGHFQEFRSTFSQAPDRNSETLALDQTVPSTSAGGYLQWSRRFGSHLVASGGDIRWVDGETQEKVYVSGAFARTRIAGGEQLLGGVFVQDVYTPHPAWELVGGIRGDYWRSYHGTRRDTPPPAGSGIPLSQEFSDLDSLLASPRIAALFHATSSTDVRASAYQGFR